MKNWIIPTALLTAIALTGCVDRQAQKQAAATSKIVTDPSTPVIVEPARTEDVPLTMTVTGSIATGDDTTVGAKAAGRLVAVFIHDGDTVRAGQVIAQQETTDAQSRLVQARANVDSARSQLAQARLDANSTPARTRAAIQSSQSRVKQAQDQLQKLLNGSRPEERQQAQAAVNRAKSDLDAAEKNLNRVNRLVDQGALSEQDRETAQNKYDDALAAYKTSLESMTLTDHASRQEDIASARESVRQAQEQLRIDEANRSNDPVARERVLAAQATLDSAQEAYRQAQTAVNDLTIRSAFNGHVSGKPTQIGTYLNPGASVARVVGLGGAYFEGELTELDVAKIQPGMAVQATTDALPGVTLEGRVDGINPLASSTGRLFTVRIALNENNRELRAGMYVSGTIQVGVAKNAVTVSNDALLQDGEAVKVFTVERGKAKGYSVKTGAKLRDRVSVTGLPSDAQVIVKGQANLADGSPVTPASMTSKAGA